MTASERDAAWEARIVAARATPPPVVTVVTTFRGFNSSSRPAVVLCDDQRRYLAKGMQVGRPLVADQVVGRLGRFLGAPVAEVALVNVPAQLISNPFTPQGTSTFSLVKFAPGIGHGSVWIPDCTDSFDVDYVEEGQNQIRFARLAVLYGWAGANDRQCLYKKQSPRHVYSVDHGHFFAGGPDWTLDSLRSAPHPSLDPWVVQSLRIGTRELDNALKRLELMNDDIIAAAVAAPPDSWGVTLSERIGLAGYLATRRDSLLESINGG